MTTALMKSPRKKEKESVPADPETMVREIARRHGVTDGEYDGIKKTLGRVPNRTEMGMYGVMYSEHCSYKSSKPVLRLFPTEGPRVLVKAGEENAGVVDIGEGLALVFKIESHNHPSAVEPFQGAATGVGGILRDIFTMGARPIALMNSLRFGDLKKPKVQQLLKGVVSGIAHYGNCLASDEQITIRNSGRIKTVAIGPYIDDLFGQNQNGGETKPNRQIEVLSFDPVKRRPRWCRVTRVWRRKTSQLLKISATMGRSWLMTPDHPSIVVEQGHLVTKPARSLKPGELLPLLARLPEESTPSQIDLISLIGAFRPDIHVKLNQPFHVDGSVIRAVLKYVEPSVLKRHRYRKRGRMPLRVYLELEKQIGYNRKDVEIYLRSGRANYIRAILPLDKDLARLLGYYLSEGCISRNGTTYKLIWVFGKGINDQYYVKDLCRILQRFGWRYSVYHRTSTIAITVSSWFLAMLFKEIWHCGEGAHNKSVPDLFFRGTRELRIEVLKGLFRGDGSVSIREAGSRVKISLSTTSQILAHQVTLMLQDLGVIPSRYDTPSKFYRLEGRRFRGREQYHIELNGYQQVAILKDWFAPSVSQSVKKALKLYKFQDLRHSFPRFRVHGALGLVRIKDIVPEKGVNVVYDLEVEETHLFVISGGLITHNCIGVPTVGGEVAFDESYEGNPLVNVLCLGILEKKHLVKGCAKGADNPVFYLGAATGRDGLGGASFASRELTESSHEDRPAVQVADPFLEKLLLEACLELIQTGAVVGIQDMGAAGLTCSTCETASRGGMGIEIDIAKVPRREEGMIPYEVMLSESQERMLVILQKGKEKIAERIFKKWDLHAVRIGKVTEGGLVRLYEKESLQAEIPARSLTDEAPVYERPAREPSERHPSLSLKEIPEPDPEEVLRVLLASPTIASKEWIYEQYDHMVQTNTVVLPGRGTSVVRIKGTGKFAALTTDGNATFVALDPYRGGMIAVCEAARNLVVAGAEPLGLSDCLNFGNPEDPEVFWQFKECVRGMSEACRTLSIPVTGGNVSFYNESSKGAIDPTPVVAMVGLIEATSDKRQATGKYYPPLTGAFKDEGDAVILLGETKEELGGSEYLKVIHHRKIGPVPEMNLTREKKLQQFLLKEVRRGVVKSAHDLSEGGLAVSLAECCFMDPRRKRGAVLDALPASIRKDALLFGETQSRILVSVAPGEIEAFCQRAQQAGVPAALLGRVGGRNIQLGTWIKLSVEEAESIWRGTLRGLLGG